MDAHELMQGRRSRSKLGEPGPDREALDRILRAALRAPDHGALRPWTLLVVEGEGRARLGDVLAASAQRARPGLSADDLARERAKPMRAPLVVVVAARVTPGAKIPEVEQLLSAGCVAYGVVLAAQAEGFGAIWRTGPATYDRGLHADLGLDDAHALVGFVYVGSPRDESPDGPRPALESLVRRWPG